MRVLGLSRRCRPRRRPEGCQPTDRQFLRMPGCCSHSFYMALRVILRLAQAGDGHDREVEILVLRHQVKVLGRQAQTPAQRQNLPRCRVADPSQGPLVLFHRHTPDASSLAPRARQTKVDLPAQDNRPPTARSSAVPSLRSMPARFQSAISPSGLGHGASTSFCVTSSKNGPSPTSKTSGTDGRSPNSCSQTRCRSPRRRRSSSSS
jgi:hypothetical protein